MQFITSSKGGRLLFLEGYIYRHKRRTISENGTTTYWKCRREECNVSLKIVNDEEPNAAPQHDHPSEEAKAEVLRRRAGVAKWNSTDVAKWEVAKWELAKWEVTPRSDSADSVAS